MSIRNPTLNCLASTTLSGPVLLIVARHSIVVEMNVGPGNDNFTTAEHTRVDRECARTKEDQRCGYK